MIDNEKCMARVFKSVNEPFHQCRCKRKIGDFCLTHGKEITRNQICRNPECNWFGLKHKYKWECKGRIDCPAPRWFKSNFNLYEHPNHVFKKFIINGNVKLLIIDLKNKTIISPITSTIIGHLK